MSSISVAKVGGALDLFWRHHPALLYGLFALLGTHLALFNPWPVFFPLIILLSPFLLESRPAWSKLKMRLLCGLAIGVGFYLYISTAHQYPQMVTKSISGIAQIEISSLRATNGFQGKSWKYSGTIANFFAQSEQGKPVRIAYNIPYTLFWSGPANKRPQANQAYQVEAILKEWRNGYYILQVKKGAAWTPLNNTWSGAEIRQQLKQKVVAVIGKSIKDQRSANFLSGMVTGEFDDPFLSFEFARFGLQHIMAISGFHFGIIAAILGFILQQFFSRKVQSSLLLLILTLYFLFLGPACSIMRAWMTISIYLMGQILGKKSYALNSLGIALLLLLFFDPLSYRSLAFQFSLLTTSSILLFMPIVLKYSEKLMVMRPMQEVVKMPVLDQHGYALLNLFRHAFALCLAVNICACPLTLYHFHKFPLMSLVYNLFFPFLVSLSVFLLIAGFLVGVVCPYLGDLIHTSNAGFTSWVLDFTFNMPTTVDFYYRLNTFPTYVIVGYLSCLFLGGIFLAYIRESFSSSVYSANL